MTEDICGSTDTESGEPCQRPAGWGTPSSIGECRDHAAEYRLPRKLDADVESTLVGAAEAGAKLKDCAAAAGVTRQTLHNWLTQGEEHVETGLDTPLADFYLTFQRARGAGAIELLDESSPEFVLERSYGYTKTERREVTGPDGGPVEVAAVPSDEQLDRLLGDGA